jgi:hypothetical protein
VPTPAIRRRSVEPRSDSRDKVRCPSSPNVGRWFRLPLSSSPLRLSKLVSLSPRLDRDWPLLRPQSQGLRYYWAGWARLPDWISWFEGTHRKRISRDGPGITESVCPLAWQYSPAFSTASSCALWPWVREEGTVTLYTPPSSSLTWSGDPVVAQPPRTARQTAKATYFTHIDCKTPKR